MNNHFPSFYEIVRYRDLKLPEKIKLVLCEAVMSMFKPFSVGVNSFSYARALSVPPSAGRVFSR